MYSKTQLQYAAADAWGHLMLQQHCDKDDAVPTIAEEEEKEEEKEEEEQEDAEIDEDDASAKARAMGMTLVARIQRTRHPTVTRDLRLGRQRRAMHVVDRLVVSTKCWRSTSPLWRPTRDRNFLI